MIKHYKEVAYSYHIIHTNIEGVITRWMIKHYKEADIHITLL